jgi:hypothetical protein
VAETSRVFELSRRDGAAGLTKNEPVVLLLDSADRDRAP